MILYLYALAEGLADVTGLQGITGEPLTAIGVPGALAVGGWLATPPAVDRVTLVEQDRVVRALHARVAALLPMRFGTIMADADAATRAVEILRGSLPKRFARVRGRDQMTLRVMGAAREGAASAGGTERDADAEPVAADSPLGPGARYLQARASHIVPVEIAPLLDALRPLERATRVERGRQAGLIATVYQLIDRGAADTYRVQVDEAARRLPALTIRLSGPSPAYAFA